MGFFSLESGVFYFYFSCARETCRAFLAQKFSLGEKPRGKEATLVLVDPSAA